jgi:hypothetical protein
MLFFGHVLATWMWGENLLSVTQVHAIRDVSAGLIHPELKSVPAVIAVLKRDKLTA